MSRPYTPKTNGKAERFIQTALREALLVGWYDLMLASKKLPIQAQVFQSWYFALHPDKLSSLDAVKTRLSAMLEAMNAIRPKLQDFYASLNDEQKAKFNIMTPPPGPTAQQ